MSGNNPIRSNRPNHTLTQDQVDRLITNQEQSLKLTEQQVKNETQKSNNLKEVTIRAIDAQQNDNEQSRKFWNGIISKIYTIALILLFALIVFVGVMIFLGFGKEILKVFSYVITSIVSGLVGWLAKANQRNKNIESKPFENVPYESI